MESRKVFNVFLIANLMRFKKEGDYFRLKYILIVLVVVFVLAGGYNIGNGAIHGRIASGNLSLTFFSEVAPFVTIDSPTNQIYSVDQYDINVTTNKAAYCEYSLDSATNVTLNASSALNVSFQEFRENIDDGTYSLEVFCNDSFGTGNASVSFSVSETVVPVVAASGSGGGGGGGGGGAFKASESSSGGIEDKGAKDIFGQEVIRLRASVSSKNDIQYSIKVHNPYDEELTYVVKSSYQNIVKPSIAVLNIDSGKTFDMSLIFKAPSVLGPGIYSETVSASSSKFDVDLLILYEIIDHDAPFEFEVNSDSIVKPGNILFFDIIPFRVDDEEIGVNMKYYLKDFEGRIAVEIFDEEVILKEGSILTKSLNIPEGITFGKYVLVVESSLGEVIVSGSDFVNVGVEVFKGYSLIVLVLIGFGALVLWYEWREHQLKGILYHQHKLMSEFNSKMSHNEFHYLDALAEVEKLRWQKHLLDKAYTKGFIGRLSHESQKSSINSAISSLKRKFL